ncbi:hypothetical protein Ahu01nite_080950 [Winogradskya humida]|uniref:Uncharacterized protein n=2 Tax=Winogradskya humida TaxID=113566 RepID=A0ABQ4A2C8_9ACTN|nr:hypothetical protein Ahu01nite_080950 [Actinoplanes humidus]
MIYPGPARSANVVVTAGAAGTPVTRAHHFEGKPFLSAPKGLAQMSIQKTTATFFVILAGALPTVGAVTAGITAELARPAAAVLSDGGVDWEPAPLDGDVVLADGVSGDTEGGVDWRHATVAALADTDGNDGDGGVDW